MVFSSFSGRIKPGFPVVDPVVFSSFSGVCRKREEVNFASETDERRMAPKVVKNVSVAPKVPMAPRVAPKVPIAPRMAPKVSGGQ